MPAARARLLDDIVGTLIGIPVALGCLAIVIPFRC